MDGHPTEIILPEEDTSIVSYVFQTIGYDIPRHYIFTEPHKPQPFHAGKSSKGKRHKSQKIRSNKRK